MAQLFIPLLLTPGADAVWLRSLCGTDELAIEDTGTANLLSLLESLIRENKTGNTTSVTQIVTADRDRILAALYVSLYGVKIESTISCQNCQQKFDLNFSLDDLLNYYRPHFPKNNSYKIEEGITFRLPTGEDELLINGLAKSEAEKLLFERCLLQGNPETDKEKVQLKMAELAPVLNLIMEAVCTECNHVQEVQFDIQSFFLTKLKQERPALIREIHCIASKYHWSQQEILDLPRNIRKQYVALIQSGN